jgi:DNA-binding transcriptional LysR family regulator
VAAILRVGFVTGSSPDKWAKRWRQRFSEPLELHPVSESEQADGITTGVLDMVIARLPISLDSHAIFAVPLYEEQPVVVVSKDHWASLADELALRDLAEEQLLNDPRLVPQWSGKPENRKSWPQLPPREMVELAATGAGIYLCPASVARTFYRKDLAMVPLIDVPATSVRLCWLRTRDDDLCQRFVGVIKGRTANSSRN